MTALDVLARDAQDATIDHARVVKDLLELASAEIERVADDEAPIAAPEVDIQVSPTYFLDGDALSQRDEYKVIESILQVRYPALVASVSIYQGISVPKGGGDGRPDARLKIRLR